MSFLNDPEDMPSSMKGPPIFALAEPGKCQFGAQPTAVKLLKRTQVSPTSAVLRFAVPDESKPLNLSTCACILSHAEMHGKDITRPYTPITTNDAVGYFDLLIKDYGPDANMSHHMHTIKMGDTVQFKHIDGNVKIQAPFSCQHILMLVGGTGITPMIQALHAILGDQSSKPKVTLLYGSKVKEDILGKELLFKWAEDHKDQFTLVNILSEEPKDSSWDGERGFVDKKMLEKYLPDGAQTKSILVFVCGPPPMYDSLSGPRDDKNVSGVLGDMGFTSEQVYKF
jgi:cytochrome-b5 reductase